MASCVTPVVVSALMKAWTLGSAKTLNDEGEKVYHATKKVLCDAALGIAAYAVYAQFGSKLGAATCATAAVLGAIAFPQTAQHAALAYSFVHYGASAVTAGRSKDYSALAKSAGLFLASLLASSTATQTMLDKRFSIVGIK